MYNGLPKVRPPKTPRGHGAKPHRLNSGKNNRHIRRAFLATFGGRKQRAGSYDRHVTERVRFPILRETPSGAVEAQREYAYHARKGWRSYLVCAPWTDAQRQAVTGVPA